MGSTGVCGFVIEHPKLCLEVALVKLESLHIHEEIIPEKAEELVEKIPHDGVFIHPIIVDRGSLVVLDGMHRVAAAKEIGYHLIPVCLVDYSDPSIQIGCWYRMFKGATIAEAKEAFRSLGLETAQMPYAEAQKLVEQREALTAFFSGGECVVALSNPDGIRQRYGVIRLIELALSPHHHMGYATDRDAPARVASSEYSAGLVTPALTKREVVETALAGHVFAQKTTRHIIPARPMFVSVPTGWLGGSVAVDEVNLRLRSLLASKRLVLRPPGQVLDRRYDEELYFFE